MILLQGIGINTGTWNTLVYSISNWRELTDLRKKAPKISVPKPAYRPKQGCVLPWMRLVRQKIFPRLIHKVDSLSKSLQFCCYILGVQMQRTVITPLGFLCLGFFTLPVCFNNWLICVFSQSSLGERQ